MRETNPKAAIGDSRIERKKEATKQSIIATAMKLFKKPGFDATTMEQIAQKVDIAKGTLYNYFPVKEAIISEYLQRKFREKSDERIKQLQKMTDTRTRMIYIFSELFKETQPDKEIFAKYIAYQMQVMVSFKQKEGEKSVVQELITEIIALGQQSAELRQDLPGYFLEDLCEFTFIEVAKQFYLEPQHFNSRETIEQGVDLFISGSRQKSRRRSRKSPANHQEARVMELVWNPESEGGSDSNSK